MTYGFFLVRRQLNKQVRYCFFSNVNWVKEQSADKVLKRVIELLLSECFPSGLDLKSESLEVSKYLREASKLLLQNDILYRNALLDNVPVKQLVLPASFRKKAFRLLHTNLGHHGRDRTLHLMRERFY